MAPSQHHPLWLHTIVLWIMGVAAFYKGLEQRFVPLWVIGGLLLIAALKFTVKQLRRSK